MTGRYDWLKTVIRDLQRYLVVTNDIGAHREIISNVLAQLRIGGEKLRREEYRLEAVIHSPDSVSSSSNVEVPALKLVGRLTEALCNAQRQHDVLIRTLEGALKDNIETEKPEEVVDPKSRTMLD